MFKHKSRPKNQRKAGTTDPEENGDSTPQPDDEQPSGSSTPALSLEDLLALRALRKAKGGIEASKLASSDPKKRKRDEDSEANNEVKYGLQKPKDDDDNVLTDEGEKVRRTVRKNNFTQQTNALDVDKHMMAYIEENLKLRTQTPKEDTGQETSSEATKTQDGIEKFGDKYKTHGVELKEGSVTNSLAMLSAIPEVDLGMDARLRNIEETEKAKRAAAEEKIKRSSQRQDSDEARLAATRFYNPHLRVESDEALLKQAKYQAMGIAMPERSQRSHNPDRPDRPEMATDEAVMERFRKRMKR